MSRGLPVKRNACGRIISTILTAVHTAKPHPGPSDARCHTLSFPRARLFVAVCPVRRPRQHSLSPFCSDKVHWTERVTGVVGPWFRKTLCGHFPKLWYHAFVDTHPC
ncbi:unnamed protein product [Ixodes hexagonus]